MELQRLGATGFPCCKIDRGVSEGTRVSPTQERRSRVRPEATTEVRWHPAQKLETLKNGDVVLDLPAGSLIEAKRFVLSLGRFGKALGPKELVGEMAEEAKELGRMYARESKAREKRPAR